MYIFIYSQLVARPNILDIIFSQLKFLNLAFFGIIREICFNLLILAGSIHLKNYLVMFYSPAAFYFCVCWLQFAFQVIIFMAAFIVFVLLVYLFYAPYILYSFVFAAQICPRSLFLTIFASRAAPTPRQPCVYGSVWPTRKIFVFSYVLYYQYTHIHPICIFHLYFT
jgi:hypothetical protein